MEKSRFNINDGELQLAKINSGYPSGSTMMLSSRCPQPLVGYRVMTMATVAIRFRGQNSRQRQGVRIIAEA